MKGRILVVAMLLISLTACKSAAPKRTLPVAAPELTEVVTIRLDNRTPMGADKPMLDAVIAAFQQKYPQYRVEMVTPAAPSTGPMDIEVAGVMQKGHVDVAAVSIQDSNLAKGSVALDMNIQRDGIDVKHYGNLMTGGLVDGHNYALPFYLIPQVVGANGQLLSAAGVTLPDQNWTDHVHSAQAVPALSAGKPGSGRLHGCGDGTAGVPQRDGRQRPRKVKE